VDFILSSKPLPLPLNVGERYQVRHSAFKERTPFEWMDDVRADYARPRPDCLSKY